ncbi:MAG TPA: type IV pilus modification protein PilV [Povalibacter sp.]|nr:type IV pilus modification protein PilV [Povalibacter sp.]
MNRQRLQPRLPASRSRSRGFTLVEVLVTVVVISVGLLGVVALQVITLRNNHQSYLRSQATVLADDIVDRIRSNRDNAPSYVVNFGGSLAATSQAGADVTEWKTALKTQLPQSGTTTPTDADGKITVTTLATGKYQVQVTIQWGERGTTNPMQFVTTTEV